MASEYLILVVDDTEASRRAAVLVLEKADFRVSEAADGNLALQRVRELKPDLVLLDAVLPDIGGIEVLRQLRADRQFAFLPVVIFSSQLTQAKDQAEGLDAGADGYIARPIGNVELIARVKAVLRANKLSRQLRESEARFRELITQQADGLLVVDAEGCIQFANPAAARIFGRKQQDLVGYPFGFPISSGSPVEIDGLAGEKPNRVLEFYASATQWDLEPAHLVSLRDITERKQAEGKLRESEQLLRIAGRIANMGAWSVDLPEVRITWSDEVCAIHDMPAGTVPALDQALAFYTPESRPVIESAFSVCAREGTPFDVEIELLSAKGQRRWIRSIGQAERDQNGAIRRVHGAFHDISQQKQASAALRLSEERFRLLSKATNDAIWDWNLITNERLWNDGYEHMFGIVQAGGEFTLKQWSDRLHPEDLARVTNSLERVIEEGGEAWSDEYRFRCQDGGYAHVLDRGRVIRDATGKPVRMIGGMTDLTKQKEHEIALSQSNRALQLLSRCNEALIRSETESGLLADICQIAVDIGGFRLAWVGYALEDADKTIACQSHAGVEHGYISEARITWAENDPNGRGPVGKVIRHGEPVVIPNLETDEDFHPWLAMTRERGFKGVIALPLKDEKRTFGVLVLYLSEVRQPLPDEVRLLQELADDMAFGIVTIRTRLERRRLNTAVEQVAASVSAATSTVFFEQLTLNMVKALGAKAGFVAKVLPGEPVTSRTIAVVVDDQVTANFDYLLQGTPCENFSTTDTCIIHEQVARQFPLSPTLEALGAEGFVGRRLDNAAGTFIGQMVVIFREPLKEPGFVVSTLQIFATRAAAELERRETDIQLREQAALLDIANEAIFVKGVDDRIFYWNRGAQQIYGWSHAEALGQTATELLKPDSVKFGEARARLIAEGQWEGELTKRTKDGRELTVLARWTLVRDDLGNPKSILAINTDITERKKLEQQFLRAQRIESIGTLAGGIAHDLNNLLAPITMGVELLRHYQQDARARPIVDTIERSAKRGADLVKQVLSFARGAEGERVSIQVPHLFREIASIVENTFPKNIRFETAVSDGLWPIMGDPTQMSQILLNLAVNARDAMPNGGTLTISAENVEMDKQYAAMNQSAGVGRYVVIAVTDSGTGIPRDVVDRIFDPFFTTKEVGKGTGLGLSTVLGIVRSNGGFINVYSEPGKGSIFKIHLPAIAIANDPETSPAETRQLPRGNGELVLVVDDEASILNITKQTLEAFGYEVATAEDGAQAIALFAVKRAQVRLVLTDMMMPVMDGPALIAAMLRIDPDVRIIAASGLNANGKVAKAANLGVKHFLPKPYSAETLLSAIDRVLNEAVAVR